MNKKFNILLLIFIIANAISFCLPGDPSLESANFETTITKILSNHNYDYDYINNEMAFIGTIAFFMQIISLFLMLFRFKYTQYIFIFSSIILNMTFLLKPNGIMLQTNVDYVEAYILQVLEGMIIALILFRDDIGFSKIKDEDKL
jgi:hypothetical protein